MAVLFLANGVHAADFYVDVESRGGKAGDENPGTQQAPWKTLARISNNKSPTLKPLPEPGDTVWVRGGTYKESLILDKGGIEGQPLVIKAFPNEKPVLDGEGKDTNGIEFTEKGSADHVVIDGLGVKYFKSNGITGTKRARVVIRNVEISGSGTAVHPIHCTGWKIEGSEIHHCVANVFIENSSDVAITSNHIHHASGDMNICVFSGRRGIFFGGGEVLSVEPFKPGLACFTVKGLELMKIDKDRPLVGQNDQGSNPCPATVLLCYAALDNHYGGKEIKGGSFIRKSDGRNFFVLHNNPEWNNKPFSPDGTKVLFATGKADMSELSKAKYGYVVPELDTTINICRDIAIIGNEIDNSKTLSGIQAQGTVGLYIKNNKIHHNGATGIQIETDCRNVWIDGNLSYANQMFYCHEYGIWLDETIDAVVQNNAVYENQKGIAISQSYWTIIRRNIIYNNKAQHLMEGKEPTEKQLRETEFDKRTTREVTFSGGRINHEGAPPGCENNAFVHNTAYDNCNTNNIGCGIGHGDMDYPKVGQNLLLNNLVQHQNDSMILAVGDSNPVLDGNIYHGVGMLEVSWLVAERGGKTEKKSFNISDPAGWDEYRKFSGQDSHSQIMEVPFVAPEKADFHLTKDSPAIDKGVPLARTVSEGKGTRIMVSDVRCFSAGYRNTKGELLEPGDEIMVDGSRTRILEIDRERKILTVDKAVKWDSAAPVSYAYAGESPDIGSFEWGR